ncbi:MAG: hypothetical protein H6558_15480 [Lewinellaceae bacterium]|nr:hypothetical protein [Lewinellaceae bacterium]
MDAMDYPAQNAGKGGLPSCPSSHWKNSPSNCLSAAPCLAGFPSPADDYLEERLSLDKYIIKTYPPLFLKVEGLSMKASGERNRGASSRAAAGGCPGQASCRQLVPRGKLPARRCGVLAGSLQEPGASFQ